MKADNETAENGFSVLREIARLRDKPRQKVAERFGELFGKMPPANLTIPYMIKRILWRVQEIRYGGVVPEADEVLDRLARADGPANLRPQAEKTKIVKKMNGVQIRREWRGKMYTVTARDDGGYTYDGRPFRSLTAVAHEITGTHWNGKSFFGVK